MAMYAAGGLTATIGLVPLARSVQQVTNRRILGVMAHGAATLAIVGTVPFIIISSIRIAQSPYDVAFVGISPWLFGIYGFSTQTAFIIFGVVLLLSGYPKWLGWTLIVLGAMTFAPFVTLGGLPAVYFLVFLILGVTLLTLRPPPRQPIVGDSA